MPGHGTVPVPDSFGATNVRMRSIITLALSTLALVANAQIIITQADMPSAGDTMRYRTTVATGIDLDLTGANTTWDFSTLDPGAEGADTAVTVGSTPLLYQFYFNNPFLYPDHRADYAMKGAGFGFQQLEVEDLYDYYKRDAGAFENVGFGATINGIPASVRRMPVDRIHSFPMEFGDTDGSFSSFELEVPTLLYFSQDQQRDNAVDGWGTLYLPADTFEVLRVRSVLQRHDSIYIDQFGIGFGFDEPETVEYKWIAAGMDAPVLLVTTVGGVATTARFYYDPTSIITGLERTEALRPNVFPNPADRTLYITLPADATGNAVLCDAQGRTVQGPFRLRAGTVEVDVHAVAPGAYVLRSVDAARPWSVPVAVQR